MQMGDHVAKMIAADLAGKPRPAFRYFDKGDMATIGRMAAVAKVKWPFKAHMSGFPAWFTWVTVHIFFLIGFRNRLSVLSTGRGPTSPSPAARASSPATRPSPAGRNRPPPAADTSQGCRLKHSTTFRSWFSLRKICVLHH